MTFDAVVAGQARGCDVVIADTAGRLATQAHLMEELKKIRRSIAKAEPGAPHEVLLVIDGNTGQNALAQVQAFDDALQLTGLIVTKLDGTAKGGVLAAIALWSRSRGAPLPVYFIGVGEKLADLQTFRAREFAQALLELSAAQRCSGGGSSARAPSRARRTRSVVLGSRTSITSPCDQSRSVSANGSTAGHLDVGVAQRRRSGRSHRRIADGGSLTRRRRPSRPRDRRGRLLRHAGGHGGRARQQLVACRLDRRQLLLVPHVQRNARPPSARAPRGRAGRAAASSSWSIGGRTSTTATTCEVTSQTTKSTHWLPRRRIHSAYELRFGTLRKRASGTCARIM